MALDKSVFGQSNIFSAFSYRDFQLYFIGQLVSVSGTWMQRIAQGWLVYSLTQSETWLGGIALASGVSVLVLAPFAGVIADRVPRRKVLIVAQIVEMLIAFVLAYLTFLNLVQVTHLGVLAFLLGVVTAFSETTRQAIMKDIVSGKHVNSGLTLIATMSNTAGVIGPVMAGILLTKFGAAWCFLLNAISYLAVIFVLIWINIPNKIPSTSLNVSVNAQLRDGINYVIKNNQILSYLLFGMVTSAFGINMIYTLLPAYATTILDSPKLGLAIVSAAIGVGSVLGSIMNVQLGHWLGLKRLTIFSAVLLPFGSILLPYITSLLGSSLLLGILGFGYTCFFVTTNTLLQIETSDVHRGRVMSFWSINRFGISPILAFGIGLLAELLGLHFSMSICGISAGVLCLFVIKHL